jgi:hypothetical protein
VDYKCDHLSREQLLRDIYPSLQHATALHVPISRTDPFPDPFCGTATTMVAALKHGRNSLGVELDTAYCKQAASRLLNENTNLFGHAQLQIQLKPHAAVEGVAAFQESAPPYETQPCEKSARPRSLNIRKAH